MHGWMDGWIEGWVDGPTERCILKEKILNLFIWSRGSSQCAAHPRRGSWTPALTSERPGLAWAPNPPSEKHLCKNTYSWSMKTLTEHLPPFWLFLLSSSILLTLPHLSVYLRKNFRSLLCSGPAMKSRLASKLWSSCLCLRRGVEHLPPCLTLSTAFWLFLGQTCSHTYIQFKPALLWCFSPLGTGVFCLFVFVLVCLFV